MKDFRLKDKNNWFYSWWFFLILIVLLLLLCKASYSVFWKMLDSRKNLTKTVVEYEQIVEKNKKIEDSMNRLSTESGVEEEIYSKFNVTKNGEKIAIIVDKNASREATVTEAVQESWLDRIKYFFGW